MRWMSASGRCFAEAPALAMTLCVRLLVCLISSPSAVPRTKWPSDWYRSVVPTQQRVHRHPEIYYPQVVVAEPRDNGRREVELCRVIDVVDQGDDRREVGGWNREEVQHGEAPVG